MFNHEFEWPAERDEDSCWYLGYPGAATPEDCSLALMYGTTDTITFNLPPDTVVVFASVEAEESCMSQYGYVRFIGSDGIFETSRNAAGGYFVRSLLFTNRDYSIN